MKLLSIRLCAHDSNMSYFDGNNVYYYKSEREYQVKHHSFDNLWEWRDVVKRIWDLDYRDLDDIAVVFEPLKHNLPNEPKNFFPAVEYDLFPAPCPVWRLDHHYAHTLSNWMMLDQDPDIHVVIDGCGDLGTDNPWSVIKNNQLIEHGDTKLHGSIGFLLSGLGDAAGLKNTHGLDIAGKLMSLQSYGTVDTEFLSFLQQFDMYSINEIYNFSHWFNQKGSVGHLKFLDWLATVHYYTGQVLVDFFKKFADPSDVIFYTGGVAQNIVWNTVLKEHFPNLIIPPHCADEGLSLGGLEWLRRKHNLPKFMLDNFPYIQTDIGTEEPNENIINKAAELLAEGKIVAWYQGHGEVGPRALGNRSILVNPMIDNAKEKINLIKQREMFRPFGASVLDEYSNQYFDNIVSDPYMLYTCKVKDQKLSAITHVDGTSRVQSVKDENPIFRKLLLAFYNLTGCPVLLNTSLNVNGKPIAFSPDDAAELFDRSSIDCLIVGNDLIYKDTI